MLCTLRRHPPRRTLLARGPRGRSPVPLRPGPAAPVDRRPHRRRHRGPDPTSLRQPRSRPHGRRLLLRRCRQGQRLPHGPRRLPNGQHHLRHGLQRAAPGPDNSRSGRTTPRRRHRDRARRPRALGACRAAPRITHSRGQPASLRRVAGVRGPRRQGRGIDSGAFTWSRGSPVPVKGSPGRRTQLRLRPNLRESSLFFQWDSICSIVSSGVFSSTTSSTDTWYFLCPSLAAALSARSPPSPPPA